MHIAICDDNIADRKQLERLLKRESDKRASSTGILYTDSFGNADTLLANPMQYDLFLIDMCKTEGTTGLDVLNALSAKGITVPIVMCCSAINYRAHSCPENILFLDKPIKAEELSNCIDHALSIRAQLQPPIELRQDQDTVYVTEPDILYGVEEGRYIYVTLMDGRKLKVFSTMDNLFAQIESYPSFLMANSKSFINGRHIRKLFGNKATLTDGTVFKIHRQFLDYAKEMYQTFHD